MKTRAFSALLAFLGLAAAAGAAPTVSVNAVWSRPAVRTGVVYATITDVGPHPDALVAATSPVASTVELHETVAIGGGGMPGMAHLMMRPVRAIRVPANGSVQLKPAGYHIMLIGLRHPLGAGERFPVTLRFRDAGTIRVVSHVVSDR